MDENTSDDNSTADNSGDEFSRPGSIQRQEAGRTQRKPPSAATVRAREKAVAAAQAQAQAIADRNRKRNRRLIGAASAGGLAAAVGMIYAVAHNAPRDVTAQCVNSDNVIVADSYCTGTPNSSGVFLFGGSQYRYYYGGSGSIGHRISGGSTVQPKGATIKTKTGTTISRGGLGSKSSSSGS